ncbi:MAG: hypothetical protein P8Y23_07985 [Candidatus Lokiarchaeota archaeon]|jgi:tRNA A58 N-methylase Trm61
MEEKSDDYLIGELERLNVTLESILNIFISDNNADITKKKCDSVVVDIKKICNVIPVCKSRIKKLSRINRELMANMYAIEEIVMGNENRDS